MIWFNTFDSFDHFTIISMSNTCDIKHKHDVEYNDDNNIGNISPFVF